MLCDPALSLDDMIRPEIIIAGIKNQYNGADILRERTRIMPVSRPAPVA
jgi:hypothetical protein